MKKEINKLIAALTQTNEPPKVPEGWYTIKQIAQEMGKSESHVTHILQKARKQGTCETKSFKARTGNIVRPIPHYRLK